MISDTFACEPNGPPKLSGPFLITLHLLPGIVFAGFFLSLARGFIQYGLTGYLALLISIPVCLAPIELGVMILWSARSTGRRSILDAVVYNRAGSAAEYVALPLFLFVCMGVLSIAVYPLSRFLEANLTGWLPAWATQEALIQGALGISPSQRLTTICLAILLSGFVAPVVEELYFRGFLLPRMQHWGWAAPAINSLLFAIYHFYFPENVPGIFVAFLPISYVVMAKKNWRIGAIVHSLSNLWGVYSLFSQVSILT